MGEHALGVLAAILAAVLGALIALGGAWWLQERGRKSREIELKRDVLRRVLGYRYRLTKRFTGTDGEPFVALNEATLIYADSEDVVEALLYLLDEIKKGDEISGDALAECLADVTSKMAKAAEVKTQDMVKAFIDSPFVPGEPGGECRES